MSNPFRYFNSSPEVIRLVRRREWAMQRFRSMKTLQSLARFTLRSTTISISSADLVTRQVYKQRRSAALAEWRALAA